MPNTEGENPDFDQLDDLFGEDQPAAEAPAESTAPVDEELSSQGDSNLDPLAGDPDLDPLGESGPDALGDPDFGLPGDPSEEESAEEESSEEEADGKSKKKKKKREKKKKKVRAKKEKAPKEKKDPEESGGLLLALRNASPYTVMLGLAFLAILIAVLCLLKEIIDYGGDIGAESYKQQARLGGDQLHLADPLQLADQFGPATTAAAVWPLQVRLTSSAAAATDGIGPSWITSSGQFGSGCS